MRVAILVESSNSPKEPSLVDPYLALVGVIFGNFATLDRRNHILCCKMSMELFGRQCTVILYASLGMSCELTNLTASFGENNMLGREEKYESITERKCSWTTCAV